jgi:hypothetical protein
MLLVADSRWLEVSDVSTMLTFTCWYLKTQPTATQRCITCSTAALLLQDNAQRAPAAEDVSCQVELGDWGPEDVVGEEDEHPVLDHAGNVHRQGTCLANQQEHSLRAQLQWQGMRQCTQYSCSCHICSMQ